MADINSRLPTQDQADGATGSAVPTEAQLVGGTDGTNLRAIATDTAGKQKVDLNDGSGNAITSNSTIPGNQVLHVAAPDNFTASTALGALNATVSIPMQGLQSAGFQLLAGTLIGTLVPEASVDGGTTWTAAQFYNPSNQSVASSIVFGSANTLAIYGMIGFPGISNLRVRVSAYTSGTANAVIRAANVTGSAPSTVISAAFGTVSNTTITSASTATQLIAANPNRKYLSISNNGNHAVQIQFGSGTGLTTTTGLPITIGTYYEFKGDNLYTGAVFGITSGTVSISVTEGTP